MNFLDELQEFLYHSGFRELAGEKGTEHLWIKEEKDKLAVIQLIPELLPGQTRIPLEDQERKIQQVENQCMVLRQKKVDRLTLMIFNDMPDEKLIELIAAYPNIWCLDRKNAKILLYENQRTDFCGLKNSLDQFVYSFHEHEQMENQKEIREMIQPVSTGLVIVNILVFLVLNFLGDTQDAAFMAQHGALVLSDVIDCGEYYRLFTSMFLHFGIDHLLQNMMILMLVGCRLESMIGKGRYVIVYFGSGMIAAITSLFITLSVAPYTVSAGASGAIFGTMGGLLGLILKDILQKKRYRVEEIGLSGVLFMIGGALSYGLFTTGVDNAAHVGGLIAGLILTMLFG